MAYILVVKGGDKTAEGASKYGDENGTSEGSARYFFANNP